MFTWIIKKLRFWSLYKKAQGETCESSNETESTLTKSLKDNIALLKNLFGNSFDIVIREFSFGLNGRFHSGLVYIRGLTDTKVLNENVIEPLMYGIRNVYSDKAGPEVQNIDSMTKTLISASDVKTAEHVDDVVHDLLSGNTVLFVDGQSTVLVICAKGWEKRSVERPENDNTVRGPREGFGETLLVNTSLLRRKIKSHQLLLEKMTIGKQTKTDICIAYLKDIANPKVLEEVRKRLERINTDAILESGYIEQFIEDAPFSVFATISNTEKPDVAAAKILEGRVAILVDGTPFVLTAPALFIESFQSAEDYYFRPYFICMLRLIRYLCYLFAVFLPSIYVALASFHQQLIPTRLLFTMAAAHEGVPFPSMIEAGLMIVAFEILREAGVRIPSPVGQAVSIVGALVLGETTVSAGFVGAPMVIIVSLTAVSSFAVPSQRDSISVLRLIFLFFASILGAYGIVMGLLGLLVHLSTLRSFGTPYFSPFAPLVPSDLKDSVIRVPLWKMIMRPKTIVRDNVKREKEGLNPGPPIRKE